MQMPDADLLGRVEVSVAEIMGARNWTISKQLTAQKLNHNYGSIIIKGLRVSVLIALAPLPPILAARCCHFY